METHKQKSRERGSSEHRSVPREKKERNSLFASLVFRSAGLREESSIEPLSSLPYPEEVEAKEKALSRFWEEAALPGRPLPLVPAPSPRGYRSTSKRRVVQRGKGFVLAFHEGDEETVDFTPSLLEPAGHTAVFRFLYERLGEKEFFGVGAALNFIIIRGSLRCSVIFNLHRADGKLIRKLKALCEAAVASQLPLLSGFMYLDPTRSSFYLEAERPEAAVSMRRLYGPEMLSAVFLGRRYDFLPTVFSQVNESVVPLIVQSASGLAGTGDRFIDLYCGYGLFSYAVGGRFREVCGLEANNDAVHSAIGNRRFGDERARFLFLCTRVTAPSVTKMWENLPEARTVCLLDPPRKGTDRGVIASVARMRPERVIHAFCSVDRLRDELPLWTASGYEVDRIQPFDMFAGTPNLEVLVGLSIKRK